MWTGRKTLSTLDQGLQQVRERAQEVDHEIQSTSTALVELRQGQAERYKNLARVRLDQLISGDIVEGLDAADRRVQELIAEREQALAKLQQDVDTAYQKQSELEREREMESDRVAEATEVLDKAEAQVQARLQDDPEYQAQLAKARKADSVAQHAEEKTEQAQTDRVEKGKPYESDPLFSYLWKRGFGTSDYSANPLTRFLDKWVARLCNYHDARPNYAMLVEIPTRLGEHDEGVRAVADAEFEILKNLEETAAQADGVPQLRDAVEQAERRVDEIDDAVQQTEEGIRELLQQRANFAAGEDQYFRQSVEALVGAFEREDLSTLYRYAKLTATAEDDLLIQELTGVEQQMEQFQQALEQHKRMQERHLSRLRELEQIRHRFKRERYDDVHSTFTNGSLLGMLLNQFLQGMATSDDLWGTIQREQRYRRIKSNPGFGSGGFGRRGGGTWRIPFPRGGGGGGFGGGMGSGGGGFRTGGGF